MEAIIAAFVATMVGMVLSGTQTFGFADTVRELLSNARAALMAAGWNVDDVLAKLDALRAKAVTANERQEAAKRTQHESTAVAVAAQKELYDFSSGLLDTAIAAVGKTSPEAKNLRRYRSQIRRPPADDATTLPEPPPPK